MRKFTRPLRHYIGFCLVHCIVGAAKRLPVRVLHAMAIPLGYVGYVILSKERNRAIHNLSRFYPRATPRQIRRMTRRVFRNLLIAFLDAVRLPELTDREFHQWIEFDETVLQNAYRKGRGVIVLSGHLSAFELQSQIAQSFSYQNITVGSTLFDPRVETIIQEIRSRRGVHYIPRKNSLGKIIKALKNGAVFGVLIDQDTTKEGVFVPFLGQPAFTPTTSIKLAVKYDIPIIYVATYRDTTGKYHIVSHPCEIPATGDSVQDIYNIAKDFNQFYSSYIEQYPEQWVWIHDRWKRTPPSPPETKGKHHEN